MRENSFPLKAHSTITGFDHKISKYRFITGNTLKIIAISVMLFDHFCKIVLQWLLNNYWYDLYDVGQITWWKKAPDAEAKQPTHSALLQY